MIIVNGWKPLTIITKRSIVNIAAVLDPPLVTRTFECNHKETHTQMVLHAALSPEDVVVVATDADVLILMVYAYSVYMVKQRWVFRYENEKCADIEIISSYHSKCQY